MSPDFSAPAFGFVVLSTVHFRSHEDGGGSRPYLSGYRCQLRYAGDPEGVPDAEVRAYFVGCAQVEAGESVPALLAFLDWENQLGRCCEGRGFELKEGSRQRATGTIQVIASRAGGT